MDEIFFSDRFFVPIRNIMKCLICPKFFIVRMEGSKKEFTSTIFD